MKKPHPRDYGFENESEVRLAINKEDERKANVGRVGFLSFVIAFLVSTACIFLAFWFLMSSLNSMGPPSARLFAQLFFGFISGVSGLVLGLVCALGARALADRFWQPSTRYPKAQQYLDANRMWIQRLQREYGYES